MPDGHVVRVQGEEVDDLIVEAESLLDDEYVAQCDDPMNFVNLSRRLLDVLKSPNNRQGHDHGNEFADRSENKTTD